jgi:hypothetical protein
MATFLSGSRDGIYLQQDTKGRVTVQGLNDTRLKFLEMGGDRNLFEKWIKEAAQVAAREATATAPVRDGLLAVSIRGYASKMANIKNKGTGAIDRRMVFGGVIVAGSARERNVKDQEPVTTGVQYSRAVSLGMFHNAGATSKVGGRVWRTTVRGKGNPYIVKAREKKRSYMVTLLNYKLSTYIKQKGFETNGL